MSYFQKAYACTICDMTFIEQNVLTKHLRRHQDPSRQAWKCSVCNLELTTRFELQKHQTNAHEIQPEISARQQRIIERRNNPKRESEEEGATAETPYSKLRLRIKIVVPKVESTTDSSDSDADVEDLEPEVEYSGEDGEAEDET